MCNSPKMLKNRVCGPKMEGSGEYMMCATHIENKSLGISGRYLGGIALRI